MSASLAHAAILRGRLRSGAEALVCGDAGVVEALGIHDVTDLEAQAAQGGDLFRTQDATDSHLGVNSQPQLCGLRGVEFVDALFDNVLVSWFGVEGLVEGDVRFAHATVSELSFVFVLGDDLANRLSLIGRESQLLDWIDISCGISLRGWLLCDCESR